MGAKEKQKEKEGYGTLANLTYWLKVLYRESPWFVWSYAGGIGISLGTSLLGVYMPSVLVKDITAGAALGKVLADLGLLGGALVCLYLISYWMGKAKTILDYKICYNQGLKIAEAAMRAEYVQIERGDFSGQFWELTHRHMWGGKYSVEFMESLTSLVTAVIGMVLYIGMLSGLSWWLLLLVIGSTAVNYIVGIRCNRWDGANHHKWHDLDNKMFYLARGTSSYEASKDVHLYHMPPWLRKLFDRELKQRLHYTVRQQANFYLDGVVSGFSQMIWEGAAYLYLIYLVCEGRLDAAGFVLYFGIITGFASWCGSIASGMRALHMEAIYVGEERDFLERMSKGSEAGSRNKEQEQTSGEKVPDNAGEGQENLAMPQGHVPEITFRNVSFQYEGTETPAIQNLNLTIQPGENIALVGLNGAGKTTFVKLLCGFYEPTEGEILADGVNRSRYGKKNWLECFSGVFQDAGLFPMSLKDNLNMGRALPESRLEEKLKMVDLEERMRKLPQGLEHIYGVSSADNGVEFSGGELQKMLLARALCKEAPVLVLDEPTAALDPLMESQLYEQYRDFSEGKTTIFISHRLASTRFCDRIVLIENGSIAEMGTHEELLNRNGRYAWMYHLQSRYYQKQQEQKEAGLEGDVLFSEA